MAAALVSGCVGPAAVSIGDYAESIPISSPSGYADGVHRGSYELALPPGALAMTRSWTVEVTVAGGMITGIEAIEPRKFGEDGDFVPRLAARIVAAGSPAVDAISGATFSSVAFMKAVEDALLN
ncbi:MAG TPA: FMN-binding protein [Spirochaetales bacterium]|nr:FMN-binding protein [Spirochaetales bacterium]HRY54065.1 FMN-binding protein [Spirochaetia bacterium]